MRNCGYLNDLFTDDDVVDLRLDRFLDIKPFIVFIFAAFLSSFSFCGSKILPSSAFTRLFVSASSPSLVALNISSVFDASFRNSRKLWSSVTLELI